MKRAAWTDARLDDLAARMDAGFEHIDRQIEGLRTEMNGLRADISSFKTTMIWFSGAWMVGLLGVIAAIFARGG